MKNKMKIKGCGHILVNSIVRLNNAKVPDGSMIGALLKCDDNDNGYVWALLYNQDVGKKIEHYYYTPFLDGDEYKIDCLEWWMIKAVNAGSKQLAGMLQNDIADTNMNWFSRWSDRACVTLKNAEKSFTRKEIIIAMDALVEYKDENMNIAQRGLKDSFYKRLGI